MLRRLRNRVRARWLGVDAIITADTPLPKALSPQRLYELTAEPGRVLPRLVTVIHQDLGELSLPDGRVVACDPWVPAEPLSHRVGPGGYRAQLRVAGFEGGDQRAAAALLSIGSDAPVRWEADPCLLGTDSATGCFASPKALEAFEADLESDSPVDPLYEALHRTYRHTWSWANCELADGLNVVAFDTGYGDGLYPLYWGLDAAGEPVCLLADLGVLDERSDPG
jgi:Protein of unknown function (DUF4241)